MLPTLSICIPTFNRAALLESALASLVPQIKQLGDEVELVVSDNCSTDGTRQVVDRWRQQFDIRYHKNEANIGVIRNVFKLVEQLARGEFCWVLGDDEMVRAGGVKTLLESLKRNSDLDYFYINYSIDDFARREGASITAADFGAWTRTGNSDLEERRVDRWETLIAEDFNALTPVYCSAFRRTAWLNGANALNAGSAILEAPFSSLFCTYPHALVFVQTLPGKAAWSSGYPWVIMCGKESWSEFIPLVILLRFHELLDRYIDAGVHPRFVEGHRRRMLGYASEPLRRLLRGEKLAGLEAFSVLAFAGKHWRYREMWWALSDAATSVPLRRVAKCSVALAALALPAKISHRVGTALAKLRGQPAARDANSL